MNRRHDLLLAGHLAVWATLAALVFLLACQLRGFDDTMCRGYHACGWRDA